MTPTTAIDPDLDLVLERVVPVPPDRVWAAWTQPELLTPWFCPKPWQTVHCEIDLRPGGAFTTVMQGPDGDQHAETGCYLEIDPGRKLVWTSVLQGGYRPNAAGPEGAFGFTATITLAAEGSGTRYTALVQHADAAGCEAHAAMGFHAGWGTALDQLVAFIQAS